LGLFFAQQVAAADVANSGSRWQHTGSSSTQAGLVTRQGALQSAKMARNAICASFVAMSRREKSDTGGLGRLLLSYLSCPSASESIDFWES